MSLLSDARNIAQRDPAAKSTLEVFLLYAGFHALMGYRFAHWFYQHKLFFLARMFSQWTRFFTGVEIHPGATIGHGLFIDHGMGIVIGETAVIGDNCTIYHGVTLGGTGKDKGAKRHPTIGNNVLIGCGAKILGPFTVGDNVRNGANSVVLQEIPPNTTVVGIPGKPVKQEGKGISSIELDQVNLPDPIQQEISQLVKGIEGLTEKLEKQEEECGKCPNKLCKEETKEN